MQILQSIFGLFAFLAISWAISENRNKLNFRVIISGIALQLLLAILFLKIPLFKNAFLFLHKGVFALEEATKAGTSFVFGYIGGGAPPFTISAPKNLFILAFQSLPLVLVVSALTTLLFYWKILPHIVRGFSWILQKIMGIGGVLGLGAAANIFVGMVESPLFIRPYLKKITRSELFAIMTCGMATIAGTVMVLYASILKDAIPNAMGHILIASLISAPAAIVVSMIIIPQEEEPTSGEISLPVEAKSAMDAITKGTANGIELLINIVAMLVVLVALISLGNQILTVFPDIGGEPITFQRILGTLMAPIVWLMGIPWSEAQVAGSLMGTKTILNEFLAYLELSKLPMGALSERSKFIMTYALCGFANFGSLGIMIGGLGTMVPERKDEIVQLGIKSIISGTIATCMTGAVVGILTF